MVTFLQSVFVVIGSTITASSHRESHQSIGYSSAARCLPSHRAHGTSPGLTNGARLSSVLDPRRPKRAHLFHPETKSSVSPVAGAERRNRTSSAFRRE